jgi:hypothetical protein
VVSRDLVAVGMLVRKDVNTAVTAFLTPPIMFFAYVVQHNIHI